MSDTVFCIVLIKAWPGKRLPLEQLRLLGALLSFRAANTDAACPSRRQIADQSGMHVRSISTATSALERPRWLAKDGKGGHSKTPPYTITVSNLGNSGAVARTARNSLHEGP